VTDTYNYLAKCRITGLCTMSFTFIRFVCMCVCLCYDEWLSTEQQCRCLVD